MKLVSILVVLLASTTSLAGLENYPQCRPDTARNASSGIANGSPNSWIICPMNNPTGCGPDDYSAQLNIDSTGFSGCALATDGAAGYWEMVLGKRTPSEHAAVGVYCKLYRNQASRFVRCRSDTGALPTGFRIEFGKDVTDNLPPTT